MCSNGKARETAAMRYPCRAQDGRILHHAGVDRCGLGQPGGRVHDRRGLLHKHGLVVEGVLLRHALLQIIPARRQRRPEHAAAAIQMGVQRRRTRSNAAPHQHATSAHHMRTRAAKNSARAVGTVKSERALWKDKHRSGVYNNTLFTQCACIFRDLQNF